MYGIFTNIGPTNHPNVGKYTIHGAYGIWGSSTKPTRISWSLVASSHRESMVRYLYHSDSVVTAMVFSATNPIAIPWVLRDVRSAITLASAFPFLTCHVFSLIVRMCILVKESALHFLWKLGALLIWWWYVEMCFLTIGVCNICVTRKPFPFQWTPHTSRDCWCSKYANGSCMYINVYIYIYRHTYRYMYTLVYPVRLPKLVNLTLASCWFGSTI